MLFLAPWGFRLAPSPALAALAAYTVSHRGSHRLRVNLGGWLVTEPFIVPALYQKYSGMTYENGSFKIIDEWHLVEQMKADGSIGELENHYNTFIVSLVSFLSGNT